MFTTLQAPFRSFVMTLDNYLIGTLIHVKMFITKICDFDIIFMLMNAFSN